MTAIYNHKYELYIGETDDIIAQQVCSTGYDAVIPIDVSQPFILRKDTKSANIPLDYSKVIPQAIKITNPYQLEAAIEYGMSNSSASGKTGATIKIHNLSANTIAKIKRPAMIMLNAGYETDASLPTVFFGTIEKVTTAKNITTILAKEASDLFRNSAINRSFSQRQTIADIFKGLIYEFGRRGVPLGNFVETSRLNQVIGTQYIVTGNLKERMTALCKAVDYAYFVSKNKLYVVPKDKDVVFDNVQVNADNVIGEIQSMDTSGGSGSGSANSRPSGVKFTTFLNGYVGLETYIYISYGDFKGVYKPTKIKVDLNWKKGPWQMTIETTGVKKDG